MTKRSFYEFFAGGGMARAGLGEGWECLFANDFDAKKRDAYAANWGGEHFHLGDIHEIKSKDLPGQADLAWASFPCQDLSLAGNGAGLNGERSGAFWGFWNLIHGLKTERRAPGILVLENVTGALTSNDGDDFRELCAALKSLGYVFGALTMDAVHFVPQSRPRLFIIAVRKDIALPDFLIGDAPSQPWGSAALLRAHSSLRKDLQKAWRWWRLPPPPHSNIRLADIIEDDPQDVKWHTRAETQRFIAMMSEVNKEKYYFVKKSKLQTFGTMHRRMRLQNTGTIQRVEVRFDGIAGCLRTPIGGSSKQFLLSVSHDDVRSRMLSLTECAALMGLTKDYLLPTVKGTAYKLLGDGVVVPVVRHLATYFLELVANSLPPDNKISTRNYVSKLSKSKKNVSLDKTASMNLP